MPKHVLIVDDDDITIKYLSVVLQDNEYVVTSAKNGIEGLNKIKAEKPDLLVLDVMMPKKTGFGVFKALKNDPELQDIPVIMLTFIESIVRENQENTDDEIFAQIKDHFLDKTEKLVAQYRSGGNIKPDRFIDKPIDPDEFIQTVTQLIGKAR